MTNGINEALQHYPEFWFGVFITLHTMINFTDWKFSADCELFVAWKNYFLCPTTRTSVPSLVAFGGKISKRARHLPIVTPGGKACRMVDIQFSLMLMLRKWREVQVKTWWYMSPKTVHAVKMLAMILDKRQRSKQPATARIPGPSRTSYGPTSAVNSTEGMRERIFASFFWIPVLNNWGNEMGGNGEKEQRPNAECKDTKAAKNCFQNCGKY